MTKKTTQDFAEIMEGAIQISEVKEYLTSFSVVIGNLIVAQRLQLDWTQKQLAEER
ncbi:hypothetical protein [Paenibacillus oralis]|uniref:hypothetical protein n=1 Tax=Paenibacillus oralis TaxID=2490856 RepID=UPI0015A7D9E9|nr:hypothetical protein [Paenibacillus oralis]